MPSPKSTGRSPLRSYPHRWWAALWQQWIDSFEPDEAMTGSGPLVAVIATGSITVVYAILGYYPPLAQASKLPYAWIPIAFGWLAAVLNVTAWRHRCRGTLGAIATLLDTPSFTASAIYGAASMETGFGIGMAISNALLVFVGPATVYGLSVLYAFVMGLSSALCIAVFRPAASVTWILAGTWVGLLVVARAGDARRALLRRQRRLEQALGAADRLANESLETALAVKLTTFEHFLRELRQRQQAVITDLLAIEPELGPDAELRSTWEAMRDALDTEKRLIEEAFEELRRNTQVAEHSFLLRDLVESVAADTHSLVVETAPGPAEARVRGAPERLRLVVENLVRNAAQAGARRVLIQVAELSAGRGWELLISDDGPGIPAEQRLHLFEPFHATTKRSGTGLGLYLCRRYLELMGGGIAVAEGSLGGAAFSLRLPAVTGRDEEEDVRALARVVPCSS